MKLILERWNRFVLIEGAKSDLIEKYPNLKTHLDKLKPKYIQWLNLRFGNDPQFQETVSIEDAIPTLFLFSQREQSINAKSKTQEFIDLVTQFIGRKVNPADITNLTIDEMNKIANLSKRKKAKVQVPEKSIIKDEEHIGKVGPWNIWLPHTMESSCQIAGYDPATRKEKTEWCAARLAGKENMFYSYSKWKFLFYVIKDNPKGDNDWIAMSFDGQTGEFLVQTEDGDTVNRVDDELSEKEIEQILGQHYNQVMNIMKKVVDNFISKKQRTPAGRILDSIEKQALKTVEGFKKYLKTLRMKFGKMDAEKITDLFADNARWNKIKASPEVWEYVLTGAFQSHYTEEVFTGKEWIIIDVPHVAPFDIVKRIFLDTSVGLGYKKRSLSILEGGDEEEILKKLFLSVAERYNNGVRDIDQKSHFKQILKYFKKVLPPAFIDEYTKKYSPAAVVLKVSNMLDREGV